MVDAGHLELIAAEADLEVWPQEHPPSPQQLREKVSVVQGVLTNIMDRVDAGLLDAAPQLKVVSHLGVGVDNIDVPQATRRGILVGNTPGVLAGATADLAFALLMSAARRVGESERWLRAGNWNMAFHPMFWLGADVHQATLGIIGLGQIGLEMAKRGRGFDMRVLYYSRTRKPDLERQYGLEYVDRTILLSSADFVSLHVPLTPETRHYIRGAGASYDEAYRHPDQRGSGPGGGPQCPFFSAQRGLDSGSGGGRDRPGADTSG